MLERIQIHCTLTTAINAISIKIDNILIIILLIISREIHPANVTLFGGLHNPPRENLQPAKRGTPVGTSKNN
jgi:hypothetical protein